MANQLDHLLEVGSLPNVSVRVLPLSAGPPLAAEAGAFVILDFPQAPDRASVEPATVYMEGVTGALYLDRPTEVGAYRRLWSDLEALALNEAESETLINAIMKECYD